MSCPRSPMRTLASKPVSDSRDVGPHQWLRVASPDLGAARWQLQMSIF